MSDRIPEESQQAADLASIESHLDTIELAGAVADGGIAPNELTDDQLRSLLAEESIEVVAELLIDAAPDQAESSGSGSLIFRNYIRKWSPAIGSLAVAATIAVVALVGLQPSAGLNWTTPADIGTLSGIKGPPLVSEQPLIAFLEKGNRPLVVIDSHVHDRGRAVSFGVGSLDTQEKITPQAIVTFRASRAPSGSLDAGVVTSGALVDGTWIDRLCTAGYSTFAASTASADACWGLIGEDHRQEIVGIWSDAAAAWTQGSPSVSGAAPEPALKEVHRSVFRGAPFSPTDAWAKP